MGAFARIEEVKLELARCWVEAFPGGSTPSRQFSDHLVGQRI